MSKYVSDGQNKITWVDCSLAPLVTYYISDWQPKITLRKARVAINRNSCMFQSKTWSECSPGKSELKKGLSLTIIHHELTQIDIFAMWIVYLIRHIRMIISVLDLSRILKVELEREIQGWDGYNGMTITGIKMANGSSYDKYTMTHSLWVILTKFFGDGLIFMAIKWAHLWRWY